MKFPAFSQLAGKIERWMRPTRRMHTVGDRPDRIAREHAGGRLLMALGRAAVTVPGEAVGRDRSYALRLAVGLRTARSISDWRSRGSIEPATLAATLSCKSKM